MDIDVQKVVLAAKSGGDIIRRYFGEVLQIEEKTNASDLRTKADVESEQAIISALQQAFPSYNIHAEESGQINKGSEYTYVVDPLDGTSNFVLGIPDFAVSIGLLHRNESVLGVIYNPILDQLFRAQKGSGAYLNDKQIHINHETDIKRSTVSYTCGYNTDRAYSDKIKGELRDIPVKRILENWAPAYDFCLLASGRLEAVLCSDGDLEDFVAGKIIVTEAGGVVTDFDNKPADGRARDFIATNGTEIHDGLIRLLNSQ